MDFHSNLRQVEDEKEKVMDRLSWLNYLKLIYNQAANVSYLRAASSATATEVFLNSLLENTPNLPLKTPAEFYADKTILGLSLHDIFSCFERDFGGTVNWDYIMERIVEIGHATHESPSLDLNELVYISKVNGFSAEDVPEGRTPRVSDLRIPTNSPFNENEPVETERAVREVRWSSMIVRDSINLFDENEENLRRDTPIMDLSCKYLVRLPPLNPSVVILNLANNRLSSIDNIKSLTTLQLLNLKNNLLAKVESLGALARTLRELYLSGNEVVSLPSNFVFDHLKILDLSGNRISSFSHVESLSQCKRLKVIGLKGNPVSEEPNYIERLTETLKEIVILDPDNIFEHSKYPLFNESY